MKRLPVYLAALLLLGACKKNNDEAEVTPQRTGPNVTSGNLTGSLTANNTLYFYYVASNGGGALTVPAAGSDQTWNYSSVTATRFDTMALGAANNSAFNGANYTRADRRNIAVGTINQTVNITTYYEISNNGWFELGQSNPALSFNIPNVGTLDYPAQNDLYAPKLPITPPLPFYLNDSLNYSSVIQQNATINAPQYFLFNAPAATRNTYSGKIKAIASGKVSLPGFSAPLDAVVVRRDQNIMTNFLLNGATPPATLLSMLGIQDGQVTSTTYYDFYNNTGVGYLGYVAVQNNQVIGAYFRKA
jgi:hypothetical protein